MRFTADGPSIPDELLRARDDGQVVFFCGAGVSRAQAKLPDFFSLANQVTNALGSSENSDARKILAEAKSLSEKTGVDGLISADRIFSLLEREFTTELICTKVAEALKSNHKPTLSAHQLILRLATTPNGAVRLVTTNFDRLFNDSKAGIASFCPPRLPDPSRPQDLDGVIYLHGRVTPSYDGAEGDGFILSSADFGRAYLSEGWATTFFKEIISRYYVVFVGYSADDPPIHYLLEALKPVSGPTKRAFAFQSHRDGDEYAAIERWRHKGIAAIPYNETNAHSALWTTLEKWATRADDPDTWTDNLVALARQGPEKLANFERGQVAHLVQTAAGARKFADRQAPPPATWLCVFDPFRRYAIPGAIRRESLDAPLIDPFDLFGLDIDTKPDTTGAKDDRKRETPRDAWSAFSLNQDDRDGITDENVGALRQPWQQQVPRLPRRLDILGEWISNVAHQSAAVWWAVRQPPLHPTIRQQIKGSLERTDIPIHAAIQQAWGYLFESWGLGEPPESRQWFDLRRAIKAEGWSNRILRHFIRCTTPSLTVKVAYGNDTTPTKLSDTPDLNALLRLSINYPPIPNDLSIPDDWLAPIIEATRTAICTYVRMETEIGGGARYSYFTIYPDEDAESDDYDRHHGLSGWIIYFSSLFSHLIEHDIDAAIWEFEKWDSRDQFVFSKLTVWAAGKSEIVPSPNFGGVLRRVPDVVLFDSGMARDLLLTLSTRWAGLDECTRSEIEARFLKGPEKWNHEKEDSFRKRRADKILRRLMWLRQNGCSLSEQTDTALRQIALDAPDWKDEYAASSARSLDVRGGYVRRETECSSLLEIPIDDILATAGSLSGHHGEELVDYRPFAGLSKDHKVRALSALLRAARKQDFPDWAWETFLDPENRKDDSGRFSTWIACALCHMPPAIITSLLRSIARWLEKSAQPLVAAAPDRFWNLTDILIEILQSNPQEAKSGIVRTSDAPDWVMEAINSPTGDITEALGTILTVDPEAPMLPEDWKTRSEQLLLLPGDLRRHALVILAFRANWLFGIDKDWTSNHLIQIISNNNEEDTQAFWGGFLLNGKLNGHDLFEILKLHLLKLARSRGIDKHRHIADLARLILSAWTLRTENEDVRWITNDEFRSLLLSASDEFRSLVLLQAENWVVNPDEQTDPWSSHIIELLRDVWPKQRAAQTSLVSTRLCDLAFSSEQGLVALTPIILPLLTKVTSKRAFAPAFNKSAPNIIDRHPEQTLAILSAILPESASLWPDGSGGILERIGNADPKLKTDPRLIELKRIWAMR